VVESATARASRSREQVEHEPHTGAHRRREQNIARASASSFCAERAPTDEEIAKKAKLDLNHVKECARRAAVASSQDVGDESDTSFGDSSHRRRGRRGGVVVGSAKDAFHRSFETRPSRENLVITLRYGLDRAGIPMSRSR